MQHPSPRAPRTRRLFPVLGCGALLAILLAGCSPQASTRPATGADAQAAPQAAVQETPAPSAQPPAAPAEPAPATPQRPKGFDFPSAPPDGKWLVDAEGRRYFEHEVAKIEGTYNKTGEGPTARVKFYWTPPFALIRETDTSFFVKVFGPSEEPVAANVGSSPEQVAASYQATTKPGDRLRLAAWSRGLPTRGQWRQGFDIADVDGDGRLDIVHGPPRKGGSAPAIFLGDGQGGWRRTTPKIPTLPLDYGDAAAADFNGDGKMDLAFASHLRGLSVLVADGQGGYQSWDEGIEFKTPADQDPQPAFSSRAIATVDWNRDGRPDIIALGEGPNLTTPRVSGGSTAFSRGSRGVVVFLNQGNGTWSRQEPVGSGFGDALVIADFNGDQRPDLAVASATQGSRTLLSLSQADGTWKETPIEELRSGATFRALAAADFDRDGRQDLAVGYASYEAQVWRTGVDILLGRPEGRWERRTVWAEPANTGIWALAAGDLDGDGAADLASVTGQGAVWVFLGDGKGGFSREESPELAAAPDQAGCRGYHAQLRDLDGDGAAELVIGFAGEASTNPFGLADEPQCPAGGSLRVWKTEKPSGR